LPAQMAPPMLDAIRRTQLIAAFQNSLRYQIEDDKAADAHETLYGIYARELGYIDAAVHHLRQALDKRRASGPRPGDSHTDFDQVLDRMSAELTRLDSDLTRRLDRYDVNAASKSGIEKVQAALQEGLSETALTVLEQETGENISFQTVPLVKVMASVALDLGRLDKARELLPEPEGPIKPEELELRLRLAAAHGDYADADRLIDEVEHQVGQAPSGP